MFGGQTVGIVTNTPGNADRLGVRPPLPTIASVSGCLMRPLSAMETLTETDVSVEEWKCTAPPTPDVLAATITGELIYDGTASPTRIDSPAINTTVYEITAVKPYAGFNGSVHHVTILCKRMLG